MAFAGTAVSSYLPTILARNGTGYSCRILVGRSRLPPYCSRLSARQLSEYVGLRSTGSPSVKSSSNSLPNVSQWQVQPSVHECPHWLNPQSAWKQEIDWTKVSVSESERVTKQLVALKIDVSSVPQIKSGFTKPGQFVQVKVGDSKPTFLAIASSPKLAEEGILEFLIKDVEGTTAAQLCSLPVGSEVEVSQVLGKGFPTDKIPADSFNSVLIFATGSGISPIRSVIEHGFDADKRKVVKLYYGAENLANMAYKDRFPSWEASGVTVIPVLSDGGDEWQGERGFVQEAYKRSDKGFIPEATAALLVGQKEMLDELKTILVEDGIAKEAILTNF